MLKVSLFITVEAVVSELNGETVLDGIQSSSSVDQNEVVNCPPSVNLLPPCKSKRRGRPRKHTIKSSLYIVLKKNKKLKKWELEFQSNYYRENNAL